MSTLNASVAIERKQRGWVYWILWFLAWFVASFVGGILYVFPMIIPHLLLGSENLKDPEHVAQLNYALRLFAAVLSGAMCGSTIGLGQWLVLRRELKGAGWWVGATMAGYASLGVLILVGNLVQPGWLDWAVTLIADGKMHWLARLVPTDPNWHFASWPAGALTLTLLGAALGAIQWLVLRGRVAHAGWWILISTVGWGLGAVLSSNPDAFLAVSASFVVPYVVAGLGMMALLRRNPKGVGHE